MRTVVEAFLDILARGEQGVGDVLQPYRHGAAA